MEYDDDQKSTERMMVNDEDMDGDVEDADCALDSERQQTKTGMSMQRRENSQGR